MRHWQGAAEAKEASHLLALKALQEKLKQSGVQYDELMAVKTAKEAGENSTHSSYDMYLSYP